MLAQHRAQPLYPDDTAQPHEGRITSRMESTYGLRQLEIATRSHTPCLSTVAWRGETTTRAPLRTESKSRGYSAKTKYLSCYVFMLVLPTILFSFKAFRG